MEKDRKEKKKKKENYGTFWIDLNYNYNVCFLSYVKLMYQNKIC